MENSYKFFSNKSCEYFPCHKMPNKDEFNCLFCFCPLYHLGDKCGGIFEYFGDVKDCTNCHLPHVLEYYDIVMSKLTQSNL